MSASGSTPDLMSALQSIQNVLYMKTYVLKKRYEVFKKYIHIQSNLNEGTNITIVGICCNPHIKQDNNPNHFGKYCDVLINLTPTVTNINELLDKIPTRSVVMQEAFINATLSALINQNKISKSDFLVNHPGGSIGKNERTQQQNSKIASNHQKKAL
ncbi:KpsF/GutQ family protein [Reticulomyxa filosa]|uniref:KpsF/GutQ family protein n=1 Tax=Reticulomyxa filosa TaxID=46433 RepID=X6NT09_RETFI|nr:KpsF/GutQ family protein [Reticulomyxa filosa]|eukprot:ETO29098.1 KpsF/GutQ family protein [Reticulomyxa filosa]